MNAWPKKTGVASRSAAEMNATGFDRTRAEIRKIGIRQDSEINACKKALYLKSLQCIASAVLREFDNEVDRRAIVDANRILLGRLKMRGVKALKVEGIGHGSRRTHEKGRPTIHRNPVTTVATTRLLI
jgi:hypothetical protein